MFTAFSFWLTATQVTSSPFSTLTPGMSGVDVVSVDRSGYDLLCVVGSWSPESNGKLACNVRGIKVMLIWVFAIVAS